MERVATESTVLDVREVQAPVVVSNDHGAIVWLSADARTVLDRHALSTSSLPLELWETLACARFGEHVAWRVPRATVAVIECARYPARGQWMILLREITQEQVVLSRELHRQRLEVTGRLVASIAHELRNAVSSLVYSADLLALPRESLPPKEFEDIVGEMLQASRRLQGTVDGLLDYARLGPTVSVPVSLREVMTRAQGFLRSYYGTRSHALRVSVPPDAEWVQGNSIVVEQVFVNLLLNAAEAAIAPVTVQVTSESAMAPGTERSMIRVRVQDDGPGVPSNLRQRIFEPFVTGRSQGTGLGLANSREAVESLGGTIVLEDATPGATFSIDLPRASWVVKRVVSAIADLRRGNVVTFFGSDEHEALVQFAGLVPELYAPDRSAWAYLAFERHRPGANAASLEDLVVVAPPVVQVAQRLPWNAEHALITIGPWEDNVGTVLGAARERLAALEAER